MIRNFTAHPVVVYDRDSVVYASSIRKYVTTESSVTLITLPSEGMLSVSYKNKSCGHIDVIPLVQRMVTKLDEIPVHDSEEKFIVSVAYATAAKNEGLDTSCLLTVLDSVYTPDGSRIVGCLGFCLV